MAVLYCMLEGSMWSTTWCDVQEEDSERAARSLNQAGVSTSTQMNVNMKTDLGGEDSGSLQVQCMLDAAQQQVSLQKVTSLCKPLA